MNLKSLMKTAWEIARKASSRFGGKAVQYMAGAMKQAWQQARQEKDTNMRGSEKQIAWATDILSVWVKNIDEFEIPSEIPDPEDSDFFGSDEMIKTPEECVIAIRDVFEKIKTIDDSSFIIENRNLSLASLICLISGALKFGPNAMEESTVQKFYGCDFDSVKKVIYFP